MSLINLGIYRKTKDSEETTTLSDAIDEYPLIVILGSPGSGKSTIFDKYSRENLNSKLLSVREFLNRDDNIPKDAEVLLLDGLDEYRSVSQDKLMVLDDIGYKLKIILESDDYKKLRIVISCREMDWYGEKDKDGLKKDIGTEAVLFNILPMDDDKLYELAKIKIENNPEAFVDKYKEYGLIRNPQLFDMMAKIYKSDSENLINSKLDVYQKFVELSEEPNEDRKRQELPELNETERYKYGGYASLFSFFTSIVNFDDEIYKQLEDTEAGFDKSKLKLLNNTLLMNDGKFAHRTIAEFLAASYLNKCLNDKKLTRERVKSLFNYDGIIPTELRGTYAWLCSIRQDKFFIDLDPYYQLIHGDNSGFSPGLKREIILEIKKYSETNPYFFKFEDRNGLEGFYEQELEPFITEELNVAVKGKNHYIYLLANILISAKEILSVTLKKEVSNHIKNENVPIYYKTRLVDNLDLEVQKQILDMIVNGDIKDEENALKDDLITNLYPDLISSDDLVPYLLTYTGDKLNGSLFYLYKVPYDHKNKMVKEFLGSIDKEKRNDNSRFYRRIEFFIQEFYLETILKYKADSDALTAKEILEILIEHKSYYENYEDISYHTHKQDLKDKAKRIDSEIDQLANELFELYTDIKISEKDVELITYNFRSLFNYRMPNRAVEILLSKLSDEYEPLVNEAIFREACLFIKRDEDFNIIDIPEQIKEAADRYGYNEILERLQVEPEWKIRQREYDAERQEEDESIKAENEKLFAEMFKGDISKNFNALKYITDFIYSDREEKGQHLRYLTPETFDKLVEVLKGSVFDPVEPELLTLESLVDSTYDARRYIDEVYFTACRINEPAEVYGKLVGNKHYLEYLYINTLYNEYIGDVRERGFHVYIDDVDPEFAKSILKKYLDLIYRKYMAEIQEILSKKINIENSIDVLRQLANVHSGDKEFIKNPFLLKFLNQYAFGLSHEEIESILVLPDLNDKNKNILNSMKIILYDNSEELDIDLAISMYSLLQEKLKDYLASGQEDEELENVLVRAIQKMMSVFNTPESIKHVNGIQSSRDQCASFLRHDVPEVLTISLCEKLLKHDNLLADFWVNTLNNKMNILKREESDGKFNHYSIDSLKKFLNERKVVSKSDFFEYVKEVLKEIKVEVEDNRDGEKDAFHNELARGAKGLTSKSEEACRDEIFRILKRSYSKIFSIREKYEGNNRVDINLKYRSNLDFEVQIECKKDKNPELATGITDQLIPKYLIGNCEYGIYLIFNFKEIVSLDSKIATLEASIPVEYEGKISIIVLDLQKN